MKKENKTAAIDAIESTKEENTMFTINAFAAVNASENVRNNNADFFCTVNSIALNVKGNMSNNAALYNFPAAKQKEETKVELSVPAVEEPAPTAGVVTPVEEAPAAPTEEAPVAEQPQEYDIFAKRKAHKAAAAKREQEKKAAVKAKLEAKKAATQPKVSEVSEKKETPAMNNVVAGSAAVDEIDEADFARYMAEKLSMAGKKKSLPTVHVATKAAKPAVKEVASAVPVGMDVPVSEFIVNDKTVEKAVQAMRDAYKNGARKMSLRIQIGTHMSAGLQTFFKSTLPALKKVCEITVVDRDKTVAAYRKAAMRARLDAAMVAK